MLVTFMGIETFVKKPAVGKTPPKFTRFLVSKEQQNLYEMLLNLKYTDKENVVDTRPFLLNPEGTTVMIDVYLKKPFRSIRQFKQYLNRQSLICQQTSQSNQTFFLIYFNLIGQFYSPSYYAAIDRKNQK